MKQTRSEPSSDAGTYAAGAHGIESARDAQAYETGAPVYDAAEAVISNNDAGGAGYFAEAHHTASFNVDARFEEQTIRADRLGSTAFGSPDIRLDDGSLYNPKYYASAHESYAAGAQMLDADGGIAAKYAGQTILVPADQLDEVLALHQSAIDHALSAGDAGRADALRSIHFDDHIHQGGASSMPLTYAEAHAGTEQVREGVLPDYVGQDGSHAGAGAEGAIMATAMALATSVGPALLSDVADVLRGKQSIEAVGERIRAEFGKAQTRSALGWAAGRGGAAGAAAFALESVDPAGVALVVNVFVDTMLLVKDVRNGDLPADEFGTMLWERMQDRVAFTALTAGAVWVVGPLGLLAPIIVRRIVPDAATQRQLTESWREASRTLAKEVHARAQAASTMQQTAQYSRTAEAAASANVRSMDRTVENLQAIRDALAPASNVLTPRQGGAA
ncbi:hypothetical protein QTI66_36130 [Variovorax sp. J22R133]|uniref:hypothetical protein n=1 Tax=Variovorax brevis TaxID=3053503 RepID=UPI002578CFE7|nr:hypothetical protein [Variovorax sp. J22R133]MDM0117543.1 hypothetical protein [Variovorax sp. J22R133]